jgi:hypothetical protein
MILRTLTVDNLELQTHQPGHGLSLQWGLKLLFLQVTQPVMVCPDDKLAALQIRPPTLNCHDQRQELLLIDREMDVRFTERFA